MKIKMDGYEVNISAKYEHGETKCNKADTMAVLNYISLLASESSNYYAEKGNTALANWSRKIFNEIHDQLAEKGYYNDVL